MSLTKEEYEISCEGLSHCPQHKYGKKRWGEKDYFHCICKGQLHDTIGESCFLFCDVDSDHTCGECVHWLGMSLQKENAMRNLVLAFIELAALELGGLRAVINL